jgi:hypothetical protein
MCRDNGPGTFDHAKANCKKCLAHTDYDAKTYGAQCDTPLVFCGYCDGGTKVLKLSTPTQYRMGCSKCDHTEWDKRAAYGG